MQYYDILNKIISCSEEVSRQYNIDPEEYNESSYLFMEDIVSNVIINTNDNAERKKLLDIIEEMLQKEQDEDTQTLAWVAVVEPIYFVCGYDFFTEYNKLLGEKTKEAANEIKNYYEKSSR